MAGWQYNFVISTPQCTVWKNEKFSLTEKIFREINSLVTSLEKNVAFTKFSSKCVREFQFKAAAYFKTRNLLWLLEIS